MFPFPSMDLYDPLVMVLLGLLAVGGCLCAPWALFVWLLATCSPKAPALYTAADRARLVQREHRRQRGRLARAVAAQEATPHAASPRLLPWTPAQHARYDDMRGKGWSELASRQAVERLPD